MEPSYTGGHIRTTMEENVYEPEPRSSPSMKTVSLAQSLKFQVFRTLGNKSLFLKNHAVYDVLMWQIEQIKIISKQKLIQSYQKG